MNYNTETIQQAAQVLAEAFKTAVIETQMAGEGMPGIAQIETDMRGALRQIGQQALGMLLSSLQKTPEREIACSCGGVLHYQRKRSASVVSVFGGVSYERAYYAGCTCKKGKAPLDEQYGLVPGAVTSGLAALLGLAGIAFSFDESPEWLKAYLLFDVAANTVRAETEQLGVLEEEREEELMKKSQDEQYLQERQRNPGRVAQRLYGSIDAAKVRIEPRPKKGEEKVEHEDWRDVKVLCWYETEKVFPAQRSTRQREKACREQTIYRARNMRYACDITEADDFGKLLWATGCDINADLSPELVFLGDGAVWIWNLVSKYFSNAIQIVDWYHAEENLERIAASAFSDLPQRANWLEDAKQALWDGQVEYVVAACQALSSTSELARKAVHYFTINAERMRYDRFRAADYLIGSGTIESACKQIVTQRLKLPGAQWSVPGAIKTAKARAAWLSGHWQSLCAQRSALPLAI
jgi:hypothetical protein